MRDGWIDKKFSECFRLRSGDGLTSKAMVEGVYPVYGGNGIAGMHNEFNLSGDNVIIGRVGALCGIARHITENIWLTDNAFKIVDFKYHFANDFLTYLLNYKNLRSLARQAAQPVISNSSLKDLTLNFPISVAEQKRIVAILDEAFAGIDTAIANTEKNLANARELFESYLNSVLNWDDDGWDKKPLGEACVLQRGFDLPKRLRTEGDFPLVSSSGIIDSHIEAKVKGPGVATGRSGSIGNVFYIEDDFWPLNTVLYVKEFFGNDPQFIHYLLKKFDLNRFASGAGVPTLNRNHVHSKIVNIPTSIEVQRDIVERFNGLSEEINRLELIYQQKLNALNELQQSLLQKAFSGELTAGGGGRREAAA